MDNVKSAGDFVTVGNVKMPRSDFYAMVEKADRKVYLSFGFMFAEVISGIFFLGLMSTFVGAWCLVGFIPLVIAVDVTFKMGLRDFNLIYETNEDDVRDFFLHKENEKISKKTAKAEVLARRSMGHRVDEHVAGEDNAVDSVTIGDDVIVDGGDDVIAVVNR